LCQLSNGIAGVIRYVRLMQPTTSLSLAYTFIIAIYCDNNLDTGLFHRAILMSGSAMSDWAASNQSLQLTMQIAQSLNCPLSDYEEDDALLNCLRQRR